MNARTIDDNFQEEVGMENYDCVLDYQIQPDSLIRLSTAEDGGRTFELRMATPDNIQTDGPLSRRLMYHGGDWLVMQLRPAEGAEISATYFFYKGSVGRGSKDAKLLSIVQDSKNELVGSYCPVLREIRVGEPLELIGNNGVIFPTISRIEAKNILPDQVTPRVLEYLRKYYRGRLATAMKNKFDELRDDLTATGRAHPSLTHRSSIDILDIRTKVGYLVAQWFDDIEKTGTLPMNEEEFLQISETLGQFIESNAEMFGILKSRKTNVDLKNAKGKKVRYELDVPYYIANDQASCFKITKKEEPKKPFWKKFF